MHPLGTRSELHLDWGSIVDLNVERLWRLAIAAGLGRDAAAEVCQLVWLRLSQRVGRFHSLSEVAEWLDDQVWREAGALLRRAAAAPAGQLADQQHAGASDCGYARRAGHDLGAATAVILAPPF